MKENQETEKYWQMPRSLRTTAALALLIAAVFASAIIAGCTAANEERTPLSPGAGEKHSYSLTEYGALKLGGTDYAYTAGNVTYAADGSVKITQLTMNDGSSDVYALIAEPVDASKARAAVIFAPGAGVAADKHLNRSIEYAQDGIVFMAVDIRGNGGKTAGVPLNIQNEYKTFSRGTTPQYYKIIFDLCAAQKYIAGIYGSDLPIYAAGSSNGGRYACVAAAIDEGFAGYVGISTSGYVYEEGIAGQGGMDIFVRSINPDTYIGKIAPREVYILHSASDSLIPYDQGLGLYNRAGEPKDFEMFIGGHGINAEVDQYLLRTLGNATALENLKSGTKIGLWTQSPSDEY